MWCAAGAIALTILGLFNFKPLWSLWALIRIFVSCQISVGWSSFGTCSWHYITYHPQGKTFFLRNWKTVLPPCPNQQRQEILMPNKTNLISEHFIFGSKGDFLLPGIYKSWCNPDHRTGFWRLKNMMCLWWQSPNLVVKEIARYHGIMLILFLTKS